MGGNGPEPLMKSGINPETADMRRGGNETAVNMIPGYVKITAE